MPVIENSGDTDPFDFIIDFFRAASTAEWLNFLSDIFTAAAYFLLLIGLIYFIRRRRDLAYRAMFFTLGLFLFLAGTVPITRFWIDWQRAPEIEVFVKFLTAVVLLLLVVFLSRLLRQALTLPSPVTLLPAMMNAISEARDFQSLLQTALQKIGEATGWEYGEAWIPVEEGKILKCGLAWTQSRTFEEFRQVSQELRFSSDSGFAGRVWCSRQFQWLTNARRQLPVVLLRAEMAKKTGIKSALGVPVIMANNVLAILVFLTRESRPQDLRMVGLVSAIAAQLALVIERNQAQESLKQAEEQLEKIIEEKTGELLKANEAYKNDLSRLELEQEPLRRSHENDQALLHSIEGIVWEYDLRSTRFSFVSQQAERMLGYPVETWLTEPTFWQDHIHGGDRDLAAAFRVRVAQEKTDDQCEYRMISSDGHARWFRDMVTVVIDNGQAVKLRGMMVDITDQKLVEEALNQERNYATVVLDTASALVLVLDPEGKVVRTNRTCEQISGYSEAEIKGMFFWDIFSTPEEANTIKPILGRLLAGQFPINFESSWPAKDRTFHVVAWSNTVLFNKENVAVNVIATGIDITKRKEVERALKEANERLKKLDEMKSEFISAASHELRTPLTSIKGYLEALVEGHAGPLNDQQKEFLGYVRQSADRLHRLLNELLDISKIESGQVTMNKELTDIKNLLKEEMMVFKAQADEKEISLDLDVNGVLKRIACDADKIREVMDNLVSNAIKYTLRGGKVKISAANHEKGIRIDVQDTGIGLTEKDQLRIFEPFQAIEKIEAEGEESTGLGLTLVKKIVDAHQGEISVQSQEGKGSTFSVILPFGAVPATNPASKVTSHE